jgi:uncharacterized protein YhjY with autotransporter beta-barrel domain
MLATLLTTGQVPLMLASDAGAQPGIAGAGYWIGGVASFGRVAAGGIETRFETSGLTAGADMVLRPGLVVGGAAGYSRAHDSFGLNGSDTRNTGQSLSLYGSYEVARNLYVDAILGYGRFESRANRYSTVGNALAKSERDGSQVFGSLAVSQQWHDHDASFAPYARLEFGNGRLDRADETGAGIGSLTYLEQKVRSSRLALGLRASITREVEFGRVTPQLRFEYGRDLSRVGAATIAYADQPGGPTYTVLPTSESRNSQLLAVGAEFLTRGGLAFGFELGSNGRFGSKPEYATRFWLSSALDGERPKPGGLAEESKKAPFAASTALRYDDNITRTGAPTQKLSDRIWVVSAGLTDNMEFSDSLVLGVGATATAEKFATYDRLDSAILGLNAELVYQAGGHFAAPRFGLFANAAYDDARSALRKGRRFELGLNARMLVAAQTGVSGVLSHSRRRARGDLYDTDVTAARVGIDHQVGERGTVRLGVEARRGDFVSSGRGMADSAAISEVQVDDDAFASRRFVAYRFPGRSLIGTLGYSLPLGPLDSLGLNWAFIRVKPTQTPDYTRFPPYPTQGLRGAGGNSPYSVQQIELSYIMRF